MRLNSTNDRIFNKKIGHIITNHRIFILNSNPIFQFGLYANPLQFNLKRFLIDLFQKSIS